MKLKRVNTEKVWRRGKKTMNVNQTGAISLSKQFCLESGIKAGNHLAFFQEEDKPVNWFVCITENDGVPVSKKNPSMAYSSEFRHHLYKSLKLDDTSNYSFPIGEKVEIDGVYYWPIITAKHLNKD